MRLHNYSDLAIWLAYLAIPFVLFGFARHRKDIPFRPILVLFGLFITGCGWTHFFGYYTFFTPVYRLDGLVKVITALVSWATVFALFSVVPRALAMSSPEELERQVTVRTHELKDANNALERERAETQMLNARLRMAMRETHHRVKNNLQIIGAIVDMQVLEPGDSVPKQELRRVATHIRSLAALHGVLTNQSKVDHEVEFISTKPTFDQLLPNLHSLTDGRTFKMQVDDFQLPVRYGTSLAILVSELVTNAIKHGAGEIEFSLTRLNGIVRLEVSDQGPGFPHDFDGRNSNSTGLELAESLTMFDLQGATKYENRPEGGASVIVEFQSPSE